MRAALWKVQANLRSQLGTVAFLALTGCAVGPDFVTPSAPVAGSWLEWRNKSLKTKDQEYRDWWRVFRDPVLDRLVEIAYQQNLTLLSAGTKVLQARAALGIQIGEFYPQQQQATGTVTDNLLSQASPLANANMGTKHVWLDALAIGGSWELDFWGKFRRGVEAADSSYLASIATYDDVLVTLLGDVATTYIEIRTLEKQVAIARANVVRQKEALAIARARASRLRR